ncbi:MAG: amidohydrolase [Bacillales bacterium]|jgi:imidazolonepropionase-like amidohydrolase|nr:amidohydrolase [Bacillales bacterium]
MRILLKNANVLPITSENIDCCDVLVENEIIVNINRNIEPDRECHIIECDNNLLLPGFIDAHTHLGLYDEGTGWAGNDANETVEPMTPHIRSIDGIHSLDIAFEDAIRYGVTAAHVMPGSSNVIGGTTCVIHTHGGNISKMLIRETAGLKVALGENPKRIHSHGNDQSLTRMGIMGMLRETFYNAYRDNSDDFRIASIKKALNREIPVRIHAHRADDILSAVRFADEFNLDLRIEHCTEGHIVVNELKDRNLQVSVGPTLNRKSKIELKNKTWKTYEILTSNGIDVSITTDHPYTPIQYLNVCAALACREGLSYKKALEGITILPAKNLGVDNLIGSIEIDKLADLVLWDNNPLSFNAKPIFTMIRGQIVYRKR